MAHAPLSEVTLGRVVERVGEMEGSSSLQHGELLTLPDAVRAFHVAVFGRTGVGKSRWMDGLIQADMHRGAPFILLDGVGASYEDAISALGCRLLDMHLEALRAPLRVRPWFRRRMEVFAQRYVLLDFAQSDPLWRLNVLAVPPQLKPWEVVADLLSAFERATDVPLEETRQLLQVIRAIASVLVDLGGTVLRDALDALALAQDDWQALIGYLQRKRAEHGGGEVVRQDASLQYLSSFFVRLSPHDRQAVVRSTWNALNLFLADPVVAKFLSSPVSTLDIQAILDGGKCLLIRLPPGLDVMTQRVLGSLLLNRIMLMASKRNVQDVATGTLPRVTLYIDEVASFAGKRFTQDLTRCRNWGIAVVAAAQHYRQEPWHTVEGQALYQAMRGNMGTTVLFRVGMDMALAEAEAVFKPKGNLVARVEREVTEAEGVSETHGSSMSSSLTTGTSSSSSSSRGDTNSSADGRTSAWDGLHGTTNIGYTSGQSNQYGTSEGTSSSQGRSEGTSKSRAVSRSRSVKLRRDFYSLDEETRVHAHAIAALPARHAYVAFGNDRSEAYLIKTLDVPVAWQTRFGGRDYKDEFSRFAAPPPPIAEPSESLEARLHRLLDREHGGRAIPFPKRRVRRASGGA